MLEAFFLKAYYEREYYWRTSDFDCFGRVRAASVLDLFQDVAGCHAEILGCGRAAEQALGRFWVLLSVKYEVLKQPEMFARVKAATWPIEPKGIRFRREYRLYNEMGELLIKGTSLWTVLDSRTRRPVPVTDIYPNVEEYLTEEAFPEESIKPEAVEPNEFSSEFAPKFSDFDFNMHVNNIRYADFVIDRAELSENDEIKTFRIDYKKEITAYDRIKIGFIREENILRAAAQDANGQTKFICKIELK